MNKKKSKTYPRKTLYKININEKTGKTVVLNYDADTGIISFKTPDNQIIQSAIGSEIAYEGQNRKKSINQIFSGEYINTDLALKNYTNVFSIDTNTKTIQSHETSISILISWDININEEYLSFTSKDILADVFVNWQNGVKKIENYMWCNALSIVINEKIIYLKDKTLIIVDSDKENLETYNNGSNFYNELIVPCANPIMKLPDNCQFAYATADSKENRFLNLAIIKCDSIASKILDELQNSPQLFIDRNAIINYAKKLFQNILNYFK